VGTALAGAALDQDRAARATDQQPAFQAGGGHASQTADGHAPASRDEGTAAAGGPRPGGGGAFLLSPAVTVGCRIMMGITMAFMLLIAL
jgi:hypothetical protein